MLWPRVVKSQLEGTCPLGATLESELEPSTPIRPQLGHPPAEGQGQPQHAPYLARHRKQGPNLIFHVIPHFYLLLHMNLQKQTLHMI